MSRRNYITLNADRDSGEGWQIHYREAGKGVPVVLLHPSPLSSAFMEPLLSLFAKQGRAIAWDTPGYGQSDPLPEQGEGLGPYVEALHGFICKLGLERPVVYGSATGAQIAIEYGKAYPQEIRGLMLENAAWFYETERESMMGPYFPDLTPRADGGHLRQVWQIVSQLYRYFPWYDTSEEALINPAGVPVEVLNRTALDYLLAGPEYDRAYRAAFANEHPGQLQPLQVPTLIMRWQGSLIKKYVDRLDDAELPQNIQMRFAGKGIEARFDTLKSVLGELLEN